MCQATIPSPPHPDTAAAAPSGRWTIPAIGLGSLVSVVNGFLESNSEAARLTKERLVHADKGVAKGAAGSAGDGRLTLETVARHHSDGDAWIVVQGQVRAGEERRGGASPPPMWGGGARGERKKRPRARGGRGVWAGRRRPFDAVLARSASRPRART